MLLCSSQMMFWLLVPTCRQLQPSAISPWAASTSPLMPPSNSWPFCPPFETKRFEVLHFTIQSVIAALKKPWAWCMLGCNPRQHVQKPLAAGRRGHIHRVHAVTMHSLVLQRTVLGFTPWAAMSKTSSMSCSGVKARSTRWDPVQRWHRPAPSISTHTHTRTHKRASNCLCPLRVRPPRHPAPLAT